MLLFFLASPSCVCESLLEIFKALFCAPFKEEEEILSISRCDYGPGVRSIWIFMALSTALVILVKRKFAKNICPLLTATNKTFSWLGLGVFRSGLSDPSRFKKSNQCGWKSLRKRMLSRHEVNDIFALRNLALFAFETLCRTFEKQKLDCS